MQTAETVRNLLGLVCTGDSAGVRYGLVLDSRGQTVGGTQNAPEFRKIMPGGEARYKEFGESLECRYLRDRLICGRWNSPAVQPTACFILQAWRNDTCLGQEY